MTSQNSNSFEVVKYILIRGRKLQNIYFALIFTVLNNLRIIQDRAPRQ